MRERGDVDRSGHVEAHHVGERQVDDGGIEQPGVERGGDNAQKLQDRPLHMEQLAGPLADDHRAKHDESADRADQHHLADGEGSDQPFAHRIVQREHEIASQHQEDAGEENVPDREVAGERWSHTGSLDASSRFDERNSGNR